MFLLDRSIIFSRILVLEVIFFDIKQNLPYMIPQSGILQGRKFVTKYIGLSSLQFLFIL